MRRQIIGYVHAFVLLCAGGSALADAQLDPKTYTSPGGHYTLRVNPSNPNGAGSGSYVFSHDGRQAWAGDKPFTLWDAVITDSGVVCGYAYDTGLDGWCGGNDHGCPLSAIIIDANGDPVMKEERPRSLPKTAIIDPTPPPSPTVDGILVHEPSGTFILRLDGGHDERRESWAKFSLVRGGHSPDIFPDQPSHGQYGFHRAHRCELVPGTPLVFVQWFTSDLPDDNAKPGRGRTQGAVLSLLNMDGKEVWRLDVPGEYDGLGDRWSDYWDLTRVGIVQSGVADRSFWFHSYSLKARVQFVLREDAGAPSGWKAEEAGRTPAGPPVAPDASAGVEHISRAPLGTIHLQDEPGTVQATPLHDIFSFAMNGAGTIACIRSNPATLVLVDQTGGVLTERALTEVGIERAGYVSPLPEGRWLVSDDGIGEGTAAAWVFDPGHAEKPLIKADALKAGALREAVGLPDGGFAAITGSDWPAAHTLTAFDPTGRVRWEAETGCMPEGLAVTTDGSIAVLCGVQNTIQVFSPRGEPGREIRLEQSLGHKPNYVAGLAPGKDGGFVLFDFGGSPSVYVLDKDGKALQSMTPSYEDGREFRVFGAPCLSPDGRVWAAAKDGVVRLTDGGRADVTLGNAAAKGSRSLKDLNAMAVTADAIYGVNSEDGALHVFRTDGTPVRVMHPEPEDITVEHGFGSIAALGDGAVFYYPSRSYNSSGFVQFSPQGERVARVSTVLDEVSEEWYGIPGTQMRWAVGYETLALLDGTGAISKRIDRRPDNAWIGILHEAAVAPDGSIAVISGPKGFGTRGPVHVCTYSRTGEPGATVLLPLDTTMLRIAFNGKHIAVTAGNSVYLVPVDAGRVRAFDLPADPQREAFWFLHASPDGRELWARRAGTTDLLRFAFE
ncbi:MAG: hypothetical protein U0637_02015 [Phycisphaerales bacterium]